MSRDQRDLDDELLGGPPPNMLTMDAPDHDTALQDVLDRVTGGGLYPHWDNRPTDRRTDDGCVVFHGSTRCWKRGTWKAWIGCVNEHVAASDVCEQHITEVETFKGGWRCSLCWDATGEVILARYIRKEPIEPELPELVG